MIKTSQKLFIASWPWFVGFALLLLSLQHQMPAWAQEDSDPCTPNRATIPPANTLFTIQEGDSFTYPLRLCNSPSQSVTITVNLDEQQFNVQPPTKVLTFSNQTWATPQAITVTAIQDTLSEPHLQVIPIRHAGRSNDPDFVFDTHLQSVITVTLIDDDLRNFLPLANNPLPTPTSTPTAQWQKITNSPPHVDVLVIHENSLIAGDRSDVNTSRGIYRSQNQTCKPDTTFMPKQSGIQVRDLDFFGNFGIAAVNGERVYYSSNHGETWQRTSDNINRFVFTVAFTNDGTAYAGTDDGVYTSPDKGVKWTKVNPTAGTNPSLIIDFYYAQSNGVIWIATEGNGVTRFTLAEKNFEQFNSGLSSRALEVWDIIQDSSGAVYIGTSDGVYKLQGTQWSPFGLQGAQVLSLELAGNIIYAGMRDTGASNGGVRQRNLGGTSTWVTVDGTPTNLTVRDLLHDQSDFCKDPTTGRKALLIGTTNGIWIYR
jgi:hypothetical protein